jgi:hypothetical protein
MAKPMPAASTNPRRTRASGFSPGGPQQLEDKTRPRIRKAKDTADADESVKATSTSPEPNTSADDSEPFMNNTSNAPILTLEAQAQAQAQAPAPNSSPKHAPLMVYNQTSSSNSSSPNISKTKTLEETEEDGMNRPMPSIKFKSVNRGLIELGLSIYGKNTNIDDEDEEFSDDGLGFSDGPEYTAEALERYRNPPGFKRENIPFDIPLQSTDSPEVSSYILLHCIQHVNHLQTRRRLTEKAKQSQSSHFKLGSSTTSKSTRQPPYVVFANPNEKKFVLTRRDLIDATRSLVKWAERDKDHVVPNAEQLETMLEQFQTQQNANTIIAAPGAEIATNSEQMHIDEDIAEQIRLSPATPQSTAEDTYMIDGESNVQVENPLPQTPTPATPPQQQRFGSSIFVGLSAVKSLVATPFTFFARRAQPGDAAATDATLVAPSTETRSLTYTQSPLNTQTTTTHTGTSLTYTQSPSNARTTSTYTSPSLTNTQSPSNARITTTRTGTSLTYTQSLSFAETDTVARTNNIFPAANASNQVRPNSKSTSGFVGVTPRPLPRPIPQTAPARTRQRQLKGNIMKVPDEPRSVRLRREEQKRKMLEQPIQSRGLLTEQEKQELWAQRDKDRETQRQSNTDQLEENEDHSQFSLNSSHVGEKRKNPHQESNQSYSGTAEAATKREEDRQKQRVINERQLEDGEDNTAEPLTSEARTGGKRKKPHKEWVRPPNTYCLPDFSSSDESDDDDESPIMQRQIKPARRSVRWADELTEHESENVPSYQGRVARQPPVVQQNIDAGAFPLNNAPINNTPHFNDNEAGRDKESPKKMQGSPSKPNKKQSNIFLAAARLKAEKKARIEAEALRKQQQELSKSSGGTLSSNPSIQENQEQELSKKSGISHSSSLNTTQENQENELSKKTGSALPSPSPLQEKANTQPAPPPPRPANAQLPPQQQDALTKAYNDTKRFTPVNGSRLRLVSNISSPSTPPTNATHAINATNEDKENDGGAVLSQAASDFANSIPPSAYEKFDIPPGQPQYSFDKQVLEDVEKLFGK